MRSNFNRPATAEEANAGFPSHPTQVPPLQYDQALLGAPMLSSGASNYRFPAALPTPGLIPRQMGEESQPWAQGHHDPTMYGTADMPGTIPQPPPMTSQPASKPSRSRPRKGKDTPVTRQPRETQEAAPDTAPLPRGRPPLLTPSSTSASSGANPGDPDDDKSRLRQRNREAASKCRVRKKHDIDKLQAEEAEAEAINKSLHGEVAALKGEVLVLKSMVLEHGTCPCPYIQNYIQNAAVSVAQSSVARDGGASLLPER